MDNDPLVRLLRQLDEARRRVATLERQLPAALLTWSESRPGASRGTATEAGARYILRNAGLLP